MNVFSLVWELQEATEIRNMMLYIWSVEKPISPLTLMERYLVENRMCYTICTRSLIRGSLRKNSF